MAVKDFEIAAYWRCSVARSEKHHNLTVALVMPKQDAVGRNSG